MTDWQPIATAPKDGTVVRLWCPDVGPNRQGLEAVGRYVDFGARADPESGRTMLPSHWKSLTNET